MNDLPFIFFAFANSEERYLPNLRKESQGVLDYFYEAKFHRKLLDFQHKEQASSRDFFKLFTTIGRNISILHYSGHADSFVMDLVDDEYSIERLSLLISGLDKLELVFLNGCSTQAMVDALLEKGVKAVIATSEDIDDNKACDFSVSFYKAFVEKGRTLEDAFKMAVSTLKNNPIKEEDLFISRSLKKSKYKNKPIPWALYYRDEDKAQLQWKLVETSANLKVDTAFLQKIEGTRKEITLQRLAVEEIANTLNQLKAIPAAVIEANPVLATQIEEKEASFNKAEITLHQLYENLSNLITNNSKVTLENRLDSAIYKLNFRTQIQDFEDNLTNQNLMAFILQGSVFCGQDLLKERLIDIAGLRYEGEFHHEIKIEFKANSFSVVNDNMVWSRIKEEILELKSEEPQAIVEELYNKYFQEKKDLVFIFDNVHTLPTDTVLPLIKAFWSNIVEGFQAKLQKTPSKNKVLLLVVDRNCELQKEGDSYVSNKKAAYQNFLEESSNIKNKAALLPMVQLLYYQDLRDWKTNQQLPSDLLSKELLTKIANKEGGTILQTIKNICIETNMKQLYFSKYRKYLVKHKL